MRSKYRTTLIEKVLVPVIHGCDCQAALQAACAITGKENLYVVGIVAVPDGVPLSQAAVPARKVRHTLQQLGYSHPIYGKQVRVSQNPWAELAEVAQEIRPDLLILEWPDHLNALQVPLADVLSGLVCNVALVKGPLPNRPPKVLVPLRGGPYAELALRLSLSVAQNSQASLCVLHLVRPGTTSKQDAPYRGIAQVLSNLPEVIHKEAETDDPAETILSLSQEYDWVVMGAAARPGVGESSLGPVPERVLQERPAGVIIVKPARSRPVYFEGDAAGQSAISVLVDKWFAENTYHANEFADLNALVRVKEEQHLTISLALPALNEEKTVGNVIQKVKHALADSIPLLDEIVLMDSDSADRTREIAASLGIPVHIHQQVLPQYGARSGKGEALWKSLYITHGDIILWIDTDIVNIHPRFVYGLAGALLTNPRLQFVKGFYRRPLRVGDKVQAGGGGRVTELTARPLINLFYPELSGVIQPLSGEYGGRRAALEQMPFFSGYGVEIGLLIDALQKFGLSAIAQVDLQERVHHNQPLESLSKMSFAILQAVIQKLENRHRLNLLDDVNRTMKLIRHEGRRFSLEIEEVIEAARPAMIEIPEYLDARSR
jgi:nucleotide-binding universal stress UspA family protein/glycosyltransferase involved in cell wall biosynthesis